MNATSDYGTAYHCAKCRSKVDCIFGDDATQAKVLDAMGWHKLPSGDWVCSKLCRDWAEFHAKQESVKPAEINDRAYHQRRAQAIASSARK